MCLIRFPPPGSGNVASHDFLFTPVRFRCLFIRSNRTGVARLDSLSRPRLEVCLAGALVDLPNRTGGRAKKLPPPSCEGHVGPRHKHAAQRVLETGKNSTFTSGKGEAGSITFDDLHCHSVFPLRTGSPSPNPCKYRNRTPGSGVPE